MRHSLAQLLAAPSGQGSPREPAAACSLPREGSVGGSSAETGDDEAELAANGGDEAELLFPGLELDEWLEAAMSAEEARPDRARSPETADPPPLRPRPGRAGGSSRLKAAAAARLNRQKKKQYVQGLESRLQGLAAENRQLRDRNRGLCRRLRDLEQETGYLRAVLANQSALGRLLSRLAGHGGGRVGLRISSSLWEDPHGESSDHDYALPVPREEEEEEDPDHPHPHNGAASPSPAGLCLHVDRDQVSVEFCSVCSRRAAACSARAPSASAPSPTFAAKIFFFRCLPCQAPLCRG
ncbi:CREB/ATF bZIP transcription factor [Eublepharis macularius]|uniref:CREB/ATF bZIP transcription factor n=1 Tax=Eublepharis macularius TaxID=481883 RepID=A0AA97J1M7_EUBMA|nr:CREB/ATF bZIP transcription factor [Eublepharis macularius]